MNKKTIINIAIYILATVSFLSSCQEDQIDVYTGPEAINMTLEDGEDGTFIQGDETQEKDIKIKLTLQGSPSDKDRIIKFALGKDNTAQQGTHFDFPTEVILKANRMDTTITCKIYKADLESGARLLDLSIAPSEDFVGGVYNELQLKLMLGFPTSWKDPTGWAATYFLGKCTQAKYAFVFEQLGTIDLSDYQGSFGYGYKTLADKFNAILKEHPRTDDDGSTMKFGNGF